MINMKNYMDILKQHLAEMVMAILIITIDILPLFIMIIISAFVDMLIAIYFVFRKDPTMVRSNKLLDTLKKIILYSVGVLVAKLSEVYILDSYFPISKVLAGFIILVEGRSIEEKIEKRYGISFLKFLFNKLLKENIDTDDIIDSISKKRKKDEGGKK